MRRSAPRPDYTPRDKLLPGTLSASLAARFHRPPKPQAKAALAAPVRPAALAVPVGQEDRLRLFPPAARPRRAPPLVPVRSPLRKWKAQLQPRYFSHAHLSYRSARSSRRMRLASRPQLSVFGQPSSPSDDALLLAASCAHHPHAPLPRFAAAHPSD
jgi:hypothetical protein